MAIVKTSSIYDSYPTPSRGKYFIHHLLLEGRNGNCLGNIDGVSGRIHSVLPPYFGFTSLKLESRLEIYKRKQSMLKKKTILNEPDGLMRLAAKFKKKIFKVLWNNVLMRYEAAMMVS